MIKVIHTQTLHKKCERALRQKAAWEGSRSYAAENWPELVCVKCRKNFFTTRNPKWKDPCEGEPKPKSVMQLARELGI